MDDILKCLNGEGRPGESGMPGAGGGARPESRRPLKQAGRHGVLEESADYDDDYRQYEIVDSGDHLGVHYYIAFDRDEKDYGYAVEGEPAYEDVDYEAFTWCGSLQDAKEMAVNYIEENAVDVDYDYHQEYGDESDHGGEEVNEAAMDTSDALRKAAEKAYSEAGRRKGGRYGFDSNLPDGRHAFGSVYRVSDEHGNSTVRMGITVGDCFVSRDCNSKDEVEECIAWLVNAVGAGKAEEGAVKKAVPSSGDALLEAASCDGLSKAVEAAGFKVESCDQDGDRGYNLVVSERLGKDDLKKVADAVAGAVEGCKVLFPDLEGMRTVYVAVDGKKVDESADALKNAAEKVRNDLADILSGDVHEIGDVRKFSDGFYFNGFVVEPMDLIVHVTDGGGSVVISGDVQPEGRGGIDEYAGSFTYPDKYEEFKKAMKAACEKVNERWEKVDEAVGADGVPLVPLGTAYVAFKVPSFAVEHFGKEPFVSKGCRIGKDGEVYHVVQLSTYGDFKSFFGNAGYLVEDGTSFLSGIYSDLQKQALKDGREQCPYKDSDFSDEIEVLMMK